MEFLSRRGKEERIVLEQQRRDFKRDHPDLYDYIANREIAKAMDVLGDRLSGFNLRAANMAWRRAGAAHSDNTEMIALLTSDTGEPDAAQ